MMKTLLMLLALTGLTHAAVPLKIAPEGSVTFLAVGRPSMLKIHGKAPGPEGEFTLQEGMLQGSARFRLEQLDTGIGLRNGHMKEKYLEVGKFPEATLTLKDAALDPASLSAAERPFKGSLELHGQERDVEGKFSSESGKVKASFQIKLGDFGIEIPSYLGITVAEVVDVDVELILRKE